MDPQQRRAKRELLVSALITFVVAMIFVWITIADWRRFFIPVQ